MDNNVKHVVVMAQKAERLNESLSLFLLNHFVGLKLVAIVCFPTFQLPQGQIPTQSSRIQLTWKTNRHRPYVAGFIRGFTPRL